MNIHRLHRLSIRAHSALTTFFVVALCFVGFPRQVQAVELTGFIKNFLVGQYVPQFNSLPGATVDPPGGETLVANNLRIRANLAARPTPGISMQLAYNFVPRLQDDQFATLFSLADELSRSAYRVADLDAFLYPGSPTADDNFVILQNLDRVQATFRAPRYDLIIGRQAVNWGSSRVINPTDVIAPFLFTTLDTENRIGVDAARARVPMGDLGEVDIGYVAGEDAKYDNSALYGRTKFYSWNTDLSAMFMQFRQQTMVGIDMARAIGGAGTWLEATSIWVSEEARNGVPAASSHVNPDWYGRLSAGADYSLSNGTYLFVEYHFNSAGASSPDDYRFLGATPAYTDGSVYLLGKHYLIPGVAWQASALWNLSGSTLVNVSDGSLMLSAIVEYNWLENFYASVGTFLGLGAAPTFDPASNNPGDIEDVFIGSSTSFASEFGTYPSTLYAELRYYY